MAIYKFNSTILRTRTGPFVGSGNGQCDRLLDLMLILKRVQVFMTA